MELHNAIAIALYVSGLFFFVCGNLGYIRFPDLYTKMHAITKADNVGMGLILLGAGIQLGDVYLFPKLFLIWLAVLFGAGISSSLLSHMGQRQGIKPGFPKKEPSDGH